MFSKRGIYLALFGICILVYANSLNNNFVVDDISAILENPGISQILRFWLNPQSFLNSLCYRLAGYNPFIYHLISLLLHSLNTILVFLFLRLFFKTGPSFIAACLFAAHPVHTEAVDWVSGRPYLSQAFFILITYLLYYRATDPVFRNKKFNPLWYVLSLSTFSYFIIGSYSFFALFPLFLILSDVTFGKWRKNWRYWLPFFAIVIIRLILATHTISQRISYMREDVGAVTLHNPVAYLTYSLYSHLWLLVWPAKLALCREPFIIPQTLFKFGIFYLLPVAMVLFFTFKRAKQVFFAISIFILFLAPTYSPIPVVSAVIAERYLYFPSVALSILIAFLYERYGAKSKKLKNSLLVILIFLIATYGIRTILRNGDWKTLKNLGEKALAVSPYSWNAHNMMGNVYLEEADIKRAIKEYEKAIEINPKFADAYNNLGLAYKKIGDKEKAVNFFQQAIGINPKFADAYNNLGASYDELGQKEKAIALYKKAIEINPQYANGYYNLANIYDSSGDKEKAIILYGQAIKINPAFVDAYNNLAIIYSSMDKREEAVSLYRKAIGINSKDANIYYNLGNIYAKMGADREAINAYLKAIEISPNKSDAYFNLSVVYLRQKQYGLAIKYCDRALELGFRVPSEFLNLLSSYRKHPS